VLCRDRTVVLCLPLLHGRHLCRRFASTYQMLRGTLVIWAGLLTIVILKRRLHSHHWFGMVLITAGAALVGASSIIADRMTRRRFPHRVHAILQVLGVRTGGEAALQTLLAFSCCTPTHVQQAMSRTRVAGGFSATSW
jgi:hypothetical protein